MDGVRTGAPWGGAVLAQRRSVGAILARLVGMQDGDNDGVAD